MNKETIFTENESAPGGEFFTTPEANLAVFVRRSPFREDANQDSLGVFSHSQSGCVLAVADGMGGMPCGAEASRKAVEAVASTIATSSNSNAGYRESLLDAIEDANSEIQAMQVGAGTTIAIASIVDNTLRTFHVGDSEILVVGQRGKVKLETMPHTPAGHAQEAGLINDEAALDHSERHLLTNFLGTPEMRIDVGPAIRLDRHDTLLVGSDGIFDNFLREELIEIIRKGHLVEVCQNLISRISQRMHGQDENFSGKPDDVAFALYRRRA